MQELNLEGGVKGQDQNGKKDEMQRLVQKVGEECGLSSSDITVAMQTFELEHDGFSVTLAGRKIKMHLDEGRSFTDAQRDWKAMTFSITVEGGHMSIEESEKLYKKYLPFFTALCGLSLAEGKASGVTLGTFEEIEMLVKKQQEEFAGEAEESLDKAA